MVLSSDRPCDIIIMINVDHISIAVRLSMLLMHIVCASTLPLRKRRLSSHWSKPASMARRRTVINSFNVITYRFYFLYLRFAISWLQNYDMLLFREIKPCSTLFQLWKKRSKMQIISCIYYSISESGKTKCARFEKRNVQKSGKTKRAKKIAHTTLQRNKKAVQNGLLL